MKIIFLDIDGVLNVITQGHDEFGGIFHKHFIDNLKRIIDETGAKIVISSTWRFSGLEYILNMWKFRKLPGEVIGITPNFMSKLGTILCRGKEIDAWIEKFELENETLESYVILDDDTDMLFNQRNNFIQCSNNIEHEDCIDIGYGLTNICTDKAIKILNK
jgi:histidinol phosphatase-like enzyme